jgi:hypothetical protein
MPEQFEAARRRIPLVSPEPAATISLDTSNIKWPGTPTAATILNHEFHDFRGLSWGEVDEIVQVEYDALERCAQAERPPWDVDDELYDELVENGFPTDLGVAAASCALSAGDCLTISSCNGDGQDCAYVMFWLRPDFAATVLDAARAAEVGLENGDLPQYGYVVVYSYELFGLFRFALELRRRVGPPTS